MADVTEAVDFLRQVMDAESTNRVDALADLRFRFGDQWPQYAIASRGMDRPQLTINETDGYCRKVINSIRQQRPRMNPHPTGSRGSIETAKVIKGMLKHIEVNSSADNAYDTAVEYAVTMGWGYFRIRADYCKEDSFNQDIYIDPVDNPFTIYFDPNSRLPDGSDANKALVTDVMPLETFAREYPTAVVPGWEKAKGLINRIVTTLGGAFTERGSGDSDPDWLTKDGIRLAEYFCIDRTPMKLVMLSDGSVMFEDRLPQKQLLNQAGITIAGDRDSFKRITKWHKQTAFEILEEKTLPWRWIPIVPVYGRVTVIDGKRDRMGMVRFAKDPARMVNFWQTSITESIALAPKAKWLVAEGTDEGHEKEWANANNSPNPVLRWKPTDIAGQPAPAPSRIQPEPPPSGAVEATFLASQNLQRVMGIYDPGVKQGAQHKSDKTLQAEQGQSENVNYDFYDNLTRSLMHCGRICVSGFPVIYDTQRMMRIIGDDGRPSLVTINEKRTVDNGQGPVVKVLNDISAAMDYDIVMETGPGYETKRQEGVAATMELMNTPIGEKVAQVADDLIVRQMDFPGADAIADRLAAANPLANIDENSDIQPKVQMMIKGLQGQLQQAQQMIQGMGQELKYKGQLEQMKQDAATKRTLITATGKAHESELWAREEARQVDSVERTRMHDTEVRATTALNVEEIRGLVKLLSDKINDAGQIRQLEHETEQSERELKAKENEVPASPAPMQ